MNNYHDPNVQPKHRQVVVVKVARLTQGLAVLAL